MAEKLLWYIRHRGDVLSVYDQPLAEFDIASIHRMRPFQRKEWVRHLDEAKSAYDKERFQLERNQPVITKYLVRTKTLREQATLPPAQEEQCT